MVGMNQPMYPMYQPYVQQFRSAQQGAGYNAYNMMYGNQQPIQQPQPVNLQWIRVSGPQGARDVSVPPGGEAWIMDENRPVFYHKAADQIGQVSTRAFRFEEISMDAADSRPAAVDMSNVATKADIEAVNARLDRLDKYTQELGGISRE